jgi:hypothetical protein
MHTNAIDGADRALWRGGCARWGEREGCRRRGTRAVVMILAALLLTGAPRMAAQENPLRSFFPYGVYIGGNNPEHLPELKGEEQLRTSIDRACRDLAEHHMNCAWPNNLSWQYLPLWLEAGRKHGVRIVPQGGGPPSFVRPKWFKDKDDFAKRVEPFYRELAEQYRDDPALLAWSLTEENEPVEWFYEAIADLTRKMDRWDPNHPMITLDNKGATAWMNARIVKPRALARDVYVFFGDGMNGPYAPIGFRSLLTSECERFREAAEAADAVFWIMGQGMGLWSYGPGREKTAWRYPTPEEIRWQVWASIQQGARGFFYFIYKGPSSRPEEGSFCEGLRDRNGDETPQYRMASEVGRQLQPLMPLLLQLDPAPAHEDVIYWENTPVSAETFVHQETGQRFLIAVNHDCTAIQPVGIELAVFPRVITQDEHLFDLRTQQRYDYYTIKLATLLPGDGTIYFVGTDEEWDEFAKAFYGD